MCLNLVPKREFGNQGSKDKLIQRFPAACPNFGMVHARVTFSAPGGNRSKVRKAIALRTFGIFLHYPSNAPRYLKGAQSEPSPNFPNFLRYDNQDTIQSQRLAELVSELYLSSGKKRQRVWQSALAAMQKLGVPQSRIDHLLQQDNPALVAEVVKELPAKP